MADTDNEPIGWPEAGDLLCDLSRYDTVFLAVSGGADSTALMHLATTWRARSAAAGALEVLCVDHGLRPEAADEADGVARTARALGLPATVLRWDGPKPASGMQAAAREARYALMLAHIRDAVDDPSRAALVTAHHRDDLAETVLMRLARGGGVDGLSAIHPVGRRAGIAILRPLLAVAKARLEATLLAAGATWVEDPSNADPRFERAQLRTERSAGAAPRLDDAHLALTAARMQRARSALEAMVDERLAPFLDQALLVRCGVFRWPWPAGSLSDEIAIRLLMRVLPAIGGISGPLRLMRAERLWRDMQRPDFSGATLGNCQIMVNAGGETDIFREPQRHPLPVVETEFAGPLVWDDRFEITVHSAPKTALRVRAATRADLDLFDIEPALSNLACPMAALLATPVVVADDAVIALPALNVHRGGAATSQFACRFLTQRLAAGNAGCHRRSDCASS